MINKLTNIKLNKKETLFENGSDADLVYRYFNNTWHNTNELQKAERLIAEKAVELGYVKNISEAYTTPFLEGKDKEEFAKSFIDQEQLDESVSKLIWNVGKDWKSLETNKDNNKLRITSNGKIKREGGKYLGWVNGKHVSTRVYKRDLYKDIDKHLKDNSYEMHEDLNEAKTIFVRTPFDAESFIDQEQLDEMSTYRAWVNQPSKLQQLHHLHGKKCIAQETNRPGIVKIHFTDGPVHSMEVPKKSISKIKLSSIDESIEQLDESKSKLLYTIAHHEEIPNLKFSVFSAKDKVTKKPTRRLDLHAPNQKTARIISSINPKWNNSDIINHLHSHYKDKLKGFVFNNTLDEDLNEAKTIFVRTPFDAESHKNLEFKKIQDKQDEEKRIKKLNKFHDNQIRKYFKDRGLPYTQKDSKSKINNEDLNESNNFKIGDGVHLGFGAKGGAGYYGKIIHLNHNDGTVRIQQHKENNPKVYKGQIKHLSKHTKLDEVVMAPHGVEDRFEDGIPPEFIKDYKNIKEKYNEKSNQIEQMIDKKYPNAYAPTKEQLINPKKREEYRKMMDDYHSDYSNHSAEHRQNFNYEINKLKQKHNLTGKEIFKPDFNLRSKW